MTIDELVTHLMDWKSKHSGNAILTSDFGILEIAGKPDVNIDINNDGTQPDTTQGPPE